MTPVLERTRARLAAIAAPESSDSCRLLHGRGGCYPGFEQVTVDFYHPILLATFFKASAEADIEAQIVAQLAQLAEVEGLQGVLVQRRYLPGAPLQCAWGELPQQVYARRAGTRFALQFGSSQNCGFFLDMEPGRRWLAARAAGKKVLNLFAYTCAFSVVAQQAGAAAVVNVDMSRAALGRGRDNHRLNGLGTDNIDFLPLNILKSWSRIRRPGPYQIAIIDPPSFQPGSFVAERDYRKLVRRLPEFMQAGGEVLLCLNSPELGADFLQQLVQEECPRCQFLERLPGAEDFPDIDARRQLKLLSFRFQ
ncbi:methyltransferase [Pseudomaricurvus alcaniphilus]|uniref:class I SAM-dependent methyltransferase n=1 Tax=Pseudomaricurvus alcaniphilus TaxID=1166482 RepID=UPI00140927C5|nr:methyltransferase [Pseudomaricurvus alcaniphilus]